MRKKRTGILKRTVGLILASVLCLTQAAEGGTLTIMAAGAEETAVPDEVSPDAAGRQEQDAVVPAYDLEDGTYVQGDVLVCLIPEVYEAYKNSSEGGKAPDGTGSLSLPLSGDEDVSLSEDGVLPLGAGEALDTGRDLMDVTKAVRDPDLAEEIGYTSLPGADSDSVEADLSSDKTAVIRLIHSDEYTTEELIAMYNNVPGVIVAEPNYISGISDSFGEEEPVYENAPEETDSVPVTGTYPDLTGLQYAYGEDGGGMDVPEWNSRAAEGESNENATGVVAVLDSGVDVDNPDLAGVMWDEGDRYRELTAFGGGKYGYNSGAGYNEADPSDVSDYNGHGTHCAGIIAAAWNDIGVSGIANGAKIMAVNHTIDSEGHSYASTTVNGMAYIATAKEAGINIVSVNCSFGGSTVCLMEYIASRSLAEDGIVVVYAAGNENENTDLKENNAALYNSTKGVISVGASTPSYTRAFFSNYGIRNTHIFAPGLSILSTYSGEVAKAFPDSDYSPPITDGDGALVIDEFDDENTYFDYEENGLSGSVKTIEGGVLKITGTKLYADNRDEITQATVTGDGTYSVMLTMSAKKPLDKPADGKQYKLILRIAGSDENMYAKVFAKTVDGTWARPDYTNSLREKFSYAVYPLDKCLNGEEIDLNNLQIRFVMDSKRTDCEKIGEFTIDRVWITDADKMPFSYNDGTSMAAPAVAGEVALLAKAFPEDSSAKRAARVLAGAVKYDDFSLRCITGGIANVKNSLNEDSYTPVICDASSGDEGSILISGYFFGTKDDTSVTISQGDKVWSSLNGDLEISEVNKPAGKAAGDGGLVSTFADDYETIVITRPAGLKAGEISISVTDSKKPADRAGYTRILNYDGEADRGLLSVPDDQSSDMYYTIMARQGAGITALKGKLYFTGKNGVTGGFENPVYDTVNDSWEMCRTFISLEDPIKIVAWRERLLYIYMPGDVMLIYVDPETGAIERRLLDTGDEDLSECYLAIYYDGEKMYMLCTPQESGADGIPVASAPTQVWMVDPVLGTADYAGELSGRYRDCIISHAESMKDGQVTRTVYVTGLDEAAGDKKLISESFVTGDTPEDFTHTYKDITPAGGFEFINSDRKYAGCGLTDGVFITGIYTADEDPATGYAQITADSFIYKYETGELLPGSMYPSLLAECDSVTYGGKLYVYGMPNDGSARPIFFARDIEDAFDDYGDKPFAATDRNVKLKKLAFEKKSYTFNRGYVGSLVPNVTFTEEGRTTGFEFESSNPYSVRIDPETGEMIASDTGSSVITVRCGDKIAKCVVSVVADDFIPEGLNRTSSELKVGEMDYLTLDKCYQTGKESLKWSSSDKKIVSVNNGLITAKKEGTATVTATRKCGKSVKTYECKVTVTGVNVPKAQAADKAVKLSVNKASLKVKSMESVPVTAVLKGTGAEGRTVRMTAVNPDVAAFDEGADTVILNAEATAGKTGQAQAKADIYGYCPGTSYVIVESFEGSAEDMNESTLINRKTVKVSVSAPARWVDVYADSTVRSYVWNGPDDFELPDAENVTVITLKKGSMDALYALVIPEVCTDAAKIKWSVNGSGVSVKNGVVTAKSVTKKNKKGEYQPAIVTARCGKATFNVYVFVVE